MRRLIQIGLFVALSLLVIGPVAAHEGREVGPYTLTFGWRVEPAYAGQLNGPELIIGMHHDESEASEDHGHDEEAPAIEATLQVEISFGPETKIVNLRAVWNMPGHYVADMIPTLPGDYTFHITGMIGDVAVDETFTSSDGEFSSVEPASDLHFPLGAPAADLETRIAQLEAQIAQLQAALAELQNN